MWGVGWRVLSFGVRDQGCGMRVRNWDCLNSELCPIHLGPPYNTCIARRAVVDWAELRAEAGAGTWPRASRVRAAGTDRTNPLLL